MVLVEEWVFSSISPPYMLHGELGKTVYRHGVGRQQLHHEVDALNATDGDLS